VRDGAGTGPQDAGKRRTRALEQHLRLVYAGEAEKLDTIMAQELDAEQFHKECSEWTQAKLLRATGTQVWGPGHTDA